MTDPTLKRALAAKNARIQMLLRMLAQTTRERDTFAEGLHQLKAEIFSAKMQAIVTATTTKGASK